MTKTASKEAVFFVKIVHSLPRGEGGPEGVGRLHPQVRAASNRRRRLLASVGMRAVTLR